MADRTPWQEHIGVGEPSRAFVRHGDTRRREVITEEGPHRGTVGGYLTDHKDGRQDAHVFAPLITTQASPKED